MARSPTRPRILYLVTEDWYFKSHRLPVARAARDAGLEVHVATRLSAPAETLASEGFVVHGLDLQRGERRVWRDLPVLARLAALYLRLRPQLVHHVAMKPVLYGTLAARLSPGTRVLNALAGLGYLFTREAVRSSRSARAVRSLLGPSLRRGHVLVQNDDDAAVVAALAVPRERVHVIRGSGVDITRFVPCPEPPGTPVALLVSRLLWDKGVGELVEAARVLRGRGVQLRVVLAGAPDPDNPASIDLATVRGWVNEGLIEWRGHVADVAQLWREAHIAVLPSYREGLPKALLEAAASGRPLVATDVTGCREIAIDGHTALTVPARSVEPLADALQRLAEDAQLRQRLGSNGRRLVESQFSDVQVAAATLHLYERMLDA